MDSADDAPPAYEVSRHGLPRRLPSTRGPRPRPASSHGLAPPSLSHDADLSSATSSSSVSESALSEKRRVAEYFIANDAPVPEPASPTPPAAWDGGALQPLRPRRRMLASIPEPALPTVSVSRAPTLPPAYVLRTPSSSRHPPSPAASPSSTSASPSVSRLPFPPASPSASSHSDHLRPHIPRHSTERISLYEEPSTDVSYALPPSHALGLPAAPSTSNTKAHNFYNSAIAAQLRPPGDPTYSRHVPSRVSSAGLSDQAAMAPPGYARPLYQSFSTSNVFLPEATSPAMASPQASTYTGSVYGR